MTTDSDGPDSGVEAQVAAWRAYLHRRRELSAADTDELEDHLRHRIADLTANGLDPDEAFLVSVKRLGSLDAVTREFAREHSDRLWKQLVLTGAPAEESTTTRGELVVMIGCALAGALAITLPALLGHSIEDHPEAYARNLGVLALAPLAAYLAWRRRLGPRATAVLVALFALGLAAADAYPLDDEDPVTLLTTLHLPIALWLAVGVAYVGGEWRSGSRRMDFVRFTGEWFIYYVLIALGGGVLTALTAGTFAAIGIDAEEFVTTWLLPCGSVAAVVVAGWLVEAKQGVIENMAPVLSRVFTPLFTLTLVAFLVGVVATWTWVGDDREVLIVFDLLLAVVLGLHLYAVSAREPAAAPGLFDRLQLVLVVAALLVDLLVLAAITARITEFGFTANKTAALGENLILLANLTRAAWLLRDFVRGRAPFAALERWQTGYLSVYAVWAWAVVLVFPLVFGSS
ncbi:MAG TPA: permease prefix domain 1-containing protein [Marmoricola sp.]